MKNNYHELFQLISIGKMALKNRTSMSPMYTMYASAFGEVTERMIQHFVGRAKGGVGMIVPENTCIDWDFGRVDGGRPVAIHRDCFMPELHRLAESVQRYGVKIVTQLRHVGRQTFSSNIDGRQPIAPSAVQSKVGGDMPRAMTEEEIEKTIQDYADAAARTKGAGFDGVELHGSHGYLISQFLSPLTNKRTDRWGGSFDNRCRFARSIMRAVRKAVGPGYPFDSLVYLAEAVKQEVSVPVIAVGSLGLDPDVALDVVKSGKADMVHFGRELLADPDLPDKIKDGKIDEIRKCIRCNECLMCIDNRWSVKCVVNPECGHEFELDIKPAPKYKNPEVSGLLNYYEQLLDRTGVDLRLGFEADQNNVPALKPDAVFIAAAVSASMQGFF